MIALLRSLVEKRVALLVVSLAVCVLLASSIPRTEFDTSLGVLLTQSDPYLQERDAMAEVFPSPIEISFALVPKSGEVFERATLLALADLNREFRQIPLALSMDSVLGWQSPFGEESLFTRVLTPQSELSPDELSASKQRVLDDPFLFGRLISPDSDLALANIRLRSTEITSAQSSDIVEISDAIRESLQARYPSVDIYLSSTAHYEQSNRSAMISDLSLLLPIVILLCTAIICYSFRSIYFGFCILSVALLTVLMTVGSLAWMGISFNSISVMAPLVVVTIAVADSVHIISLFRQALLQGLGPVDAMRQSIALNFRPISLATVTTIIGFASLNFASAPAVSSFGSVVALGVGFAYVLTLSVLPGAILLFASRLRVDERTGTIGLLSAVTGFCKGLVFRHGRLMLISVSVLACIALGLSLRNSTDFDRASFISKDSPLYDYYENVNARMNQGTQLTYGVRVPNAYGVIEPKFLQQLDRFSQWMNTQETVVGVASLVEVIKTVNQIMHEEEGEGEAYLIPDDAESIDEALFNYSVAQESNFTLSTLANDDFTMMRFFVATNTQSNQSIITLNALIDEKFAQEFSEAELLHGSSTLLFARMDKAVTQELLQGYVLSLIMITITLMFGMRSAYLGLLSVLPNLLPAVFVFGVWGLFVGQVDPFVMMLFSISIGLVVDDTVHVLSTYQSGRKSGLAPNAAVASALEKAGPALIITTAVMAFGTCVLIAASTLYFQQAATLLVPIVVLALILDLTFFPALLVRFDRARELPNAATAEASKGL